MTEPSSARGTRLTQKGLATRARIVAIAADLIHERGVRGVSLEDIKKAAGISGSQLSHYFEDKRSLVRAVVAFQADALATSHLRPELGKLNTINDLRTWVDLTVAEMAAQEFRGGCRFGSLAAELAEADESLRDDLTSGIDRWIDVLRSGLESMQARGELTPDADPAALTAVLAAAYQGGYLLSQAKRDSKPLRAALIGAVDHIESHATKATHRNRRKPRRSGIA